MLVEKEIISPATYWYPDAKTGLPRKLVVTPELTKYWHDKGNEMIGLGLTVPVPFEHDFNSHPMTPKDNLLNNAGEVKEYRLKNDVLFGVVDVQDPDAKKKIGHSIRWTSPWINSFTDGDGRKWDNVISHLALTTRPRVTKQAPFGSIAAALSLASETKVDLSDQFSLAVAGGATDGFSLSKAGRLVQRKRDNKLCPQYPIAFSLFSGGIKLADDDMVALDDDGEESKPKPKKKAKPKPGAADESQQNDDLSDDENDDDSSLLPDANQLADQAGDVKMEELLCDLLNALGVMMPDCVGESEFKRALYEATMAKIKELAAKGLASGDANAQAAGANTTSPAGQGQANPIIQQEQQPMYMSLEDINKIPDLTMKNIALSMYNENVRLRGEVDLSTKTANSLRDSKLKEENTKRNNRVAMLGKLSPRVKADLDMMLALPSMALSMGEGGAVVDPMEHTLAVLEKGLQDIPRLLTVESSALSIQTQPTDGEMSQEDIDKTADTYARMMGCPPERKAG